MESIAKAKYLRGSAQKARLVIDLIRGKRVNEARNILRFTNKRAAAHIAKCLLSAYDNINQAAERANVAIDEADVWVKAAFVDMGPTKRRFRTRPAPQGRAYRERRHYCHVTIELTNAEPTKDKNGKKIKVEDSAVTPKATTRKRTGGAAAAPRAKKAAPTTPAAVEEEKLNDAVTQNPTPIETDNQAQFNAEAADAKDATTQTPAELNATKPADEKQADINEELERQ